MKVFKLEKNNEHHIGNDMFNMKLEDSKKINRIIINNPLQSNCLCIINNLMCKLQENTNVAHVIIASENRQLEPSIRVGSLNICYEFNKVETYDNLEIDIVSIHKNQEIDVIEGHFLIILPGGNIHIKLEEPQEKILLQINLDQQDI